MNLHRISALAVCLALTVSLLAGCATPGTGASSSVSASTSGNTVTPTVSTKLSVNKRDVTLYNQGDTVQLSLSNVPQGAQVRWEADRPEVIDVTEDGLVTALLPGLAVVYIFVDNERLSCTIRCKFEIYPNDPDYVDVPDEDPLVLNQAEHTFTQAGQTFQVKVLENQPEGTSLVWSTSDKSVVTVADDGTVTAVGEGTATISVAVITDPGLVGVCKVTCSFAGASASAN